MAVWFWVARPAAGVQDDIPPADAHQRSYYIQTYLRSVANTLIVDEQRLFDVGIALHVPDHVIRRIRVDNQTSIVNAGFAVLMEWRVQLGTRVVFDTLHMVLSRVFGELGLELPFRDIPYSKYSKGNRRTSIGYCPHLWKSPLQPFQPAQQSP